MKCIKILSVAALIMFMDMNSLQVQASALPNIPPDLHLVEPELRLIRGNGYQYALERSGYDVQPGVDAMQVIGAMETASQLADYAFQEDEDYQATIQYVEDRSGLPDSLQGLNAELYFAKIDYLDMQIGIYINEAGEALGNAVVQYKPQIQDTLAGVAGTISNNMLGRQQDLTAIGLEKSFYLEPGHIDGCVGLTSYTWHRVKGNFGQYENYYRGSWMQVVSAPDEAMFFTTVSDGDTSGIPAAVFCIAKSAPEVIGKFDRKITSLDDFGTVIEGASGQNFAVARNGPYSNSPVIDIDGYHLYYGVISHSVGASTRFNCVNPFLSINMTGDEFIEWFRTQFKPDFGGILSAQNVGLNPNGLSEPVAGQSYNLDSIVEHNRAVSEAVPEIRPIGDPYSEPLPENAPLYEPVSGLETIPKPELLPFPEYTPLPDTEPSPEPGTDPDLDPDSPFKPVPAKGIQDKFPFCIPFDLVDAFELFVAEPETPVWKFSFNIPEINRTVEFEIDLSVFDDLARLTRLLLMAAFIIALIVGTRSLISN